jgi:hypothetical protein
MKTKILVPALKLIGTLLLATSSPAWADDPPAILSVDVNNVVIYQLDNPDVTKFGTNPNIVPNVANRNFVPVVWMADITAVNGKPAKGMWTAKGNAAAVSRTPTASTGTAIGDSPATVFWDWVFEIQNPDGTPIGTIMCSGWGGTAPPPGSPSSFLAANMTITGGTGAYLGVRGQGAQAGNYVGPRIASVVEDTAARRVNGGGRRRYDYYLLPLARPAIVNTGNGPAVVHASDFSPVTAANPARSGEILALFATGLGPTRPGVDPGQPFPPSPAQLVNSPVEVSVNGALSQVLYAGGYPSATNAYQVNFRLPDGVPPGLATIGLTAAFIPGPTVQIPVR